MNAIEAQKFDEPKINHNVSLLVGIITLRLGNVSLARQVFADAITQTDELLSKTPNFYSALDAKGLGLCGLALCNDKQQIPAAIGTFRAARKIAPHAGVIKRLLRLFDELVKCDEEGILTDVRDAVEGKE